MRLQKISYLNTETMLIAILIFLRDDLRDDFLKCLV